MAIKLTLDDVEHELEIVRYRPHLVVRIDGRQHEISGQGFGLDGHDTAVVDGDTIDFVRAQHGLRSIVRTNGRTFDVALVDPRDVATSGGQSQDVVKAPMPGAVVSIHCNVGDVVARGDKIVTIESMKLQTALVAPRDGIVEALLKNEGQTFERDEIIARLAPATGEQ